MGNGWLIESLERRALFSTGWHPQELTGDKRIDSVDFNVFAASHSPPVSPASNLVIDYSGSSHIVTIKPVILTWKPPDLDGNGAVDSIDFNIFAAQHAS